MRIKQFFRRPESLLFFGMLIGPFIYHSQTALAGGSNATILGNSATAYYKWFASWTVISDGRFKNECKGKCAWAGFCFKAKAGHVQPSFKTIG